MTSGPGNRMRELRRLRDEVAARRQYVEATKAPWVVPAMAFVSGLFVPPITGSRSVNPVKQAWGLVRGYAVRAMRFIVYRNLWQLLRAPVGSTAGPLTQKTESGR